MPETITRPPGPEMLRDVTIVGLLSKAWTRTVKAADGVTDVEEMMLSGVASSSVRDRQGDTITAQCQAMMLDQLVTGIGRDGHALTMFLNHEYKVPEDVLGNVNESKLSASAPTGEDEAIIDLEIVCRVTKENPRAVMAWKIVNDGVTLGYSIGGRVTDYEVDEENDDGSSWCPPMIINGFALWEISLCGIPANPRAYTDQLKTASVEKREQALTAAQKFMREMGFDEEAPAPTHNWAQDIRRGLVKRATRSERVRAALRDDLKVAAGVIVLPPVDEEQMRSLGRKAAIETLERAQAEADDSDGNMLRLALACGIAALKTQPHEPIAGEAQCAWKDGCEQKNAAGTLFCDEHVKQAKISSDRAKDVSNPEDPDYDPTDPDYDPTRDPSSDEYDPSNDLTAEAQSAITLSIGHLQAAMEHGMCDDSLTHAKKAHGSLVGLMTGTNPEDEPEATGDPEDETQSSLNNLSELARALPPEQRSALIAAAQNVAKDASLVVLTGPKDLDEELAAKQADLERVDAEVKAAAEKRDAAAKALDEATKAEKALRDKIAELETTPTGRRTAPAASAFTADAQHDPSESPWSRTRDEGRKAHATAMHGGDAVDNPGQRPG